MLLELSIENLALFERARLDFGAGLDVITGETGAGKSLLIGALEVLLGQRAKAAVVRKGADEARVEGRFVLSAQIAREPAIREFVEQHLPAVLEGWDELGEDEERELVLSRSVSREGRSRAWIDHRPVALRLLRSLASMLVEIHGQNEHQRLLLPSEQLTLVDAFGDAPGHSAGSAGGRPGSRSTGHAGKLAAYRAAREDWRAKVERRLLWETETRDRRDRLELLRFQAAELAGAKLVPGEAEELERERQVQRHASELGTVLADLVADLGDEDASATTRIASARSVLERWEGKVDALAPAAEDLRAATLHLEEALGTVGRFLAALDFSPERLETVEARLYELEELQHRYHTDASGLLARQGAIEAELAELDTDGTGLDALDEACRAARETLERSAEALTRSRRALRQRLQKAVVGSLARLGLARATFEVRVEPRVSERVTATSATNVDEAKAAQLAELDRFGPTGVDRVEFMLCANPGEEPQPLRDVASGGETARIMLALRTALAVRQTVPTLVFDEIDSGVGGRLGPEVGEHLRKLSEHHQILCVTHLPAIAAAAHHHFKVEKHARDGRTRTGVTRLEGRARIDEVADMIAGGAEHKTARAEARRLLAGDRH